MKLRYLHVDMDAFYASIEQRDHPELQGKPVLVGAAGDHRGVVAAASYEARRFGIHSAMPSREAAQRCPDAVFLPVDRPRYLAESEHIFEILARFSPTIEPLSIDEAFLDTQGLEKLHPDPVELAKRIRETIRNERNLTASVGVAPNLFLAKLASDMNKPDGLTVTPENRGEIISFLAPLPVHRLWGVGQVTRKILEQNGLRTIGDLQQISQDKLSHLLGRHAAQHLKTLADGIDDRNLEGGGPEKSISREHTFAEDSRLRNEIELRLCELIEDVGQKLRSSQQYAKCVQLKVRWSDFRTFTRRKKVREPICDDHSLRQAAFDLFDKIELKAPVRLIGFGVTELTEKKSAQLDLFDTPAQQAKHENISHTVDRIRQQYGPDSIQRPHKL